MSTAASVEPIAISIAAAAQATGLSEKTIQRAIRRGELASARVGSRRLLRPDDLRSWIDGMVEQ